MPKKFLIEWLQLALEKIDKENFGFLPFLGDRVEVLTDIFPDEFWSKELVFISVVLHIAGATMKGHYDDFTDKQKEEIKNSFKIYIKTLSDGIANEDKDTIRNSLRDICYKIYEVHKE